MAGRCKQKSSDVDHAVIGTAVAVTVKEKEKIRNEPNSETEDLPWKQQSAPFRKWLKSASKPENVAFHYPESMGLLEALLETAERQNVELIIVDAPLSEVHKKELLPFIPNFYEDVAALVDKFETAHYIRFDHNTVPGNMTYFLDAIHLTPDGWQKFYFDYLTDAITYGLKTGDSDNPS